MYPQLSKCPVCGEDLTVTRLHCRQCDTTLEGHFSQVTGPFSQLSQEQQNFVLAFVRCEGRFTRLEEELSLSYPTLRNRLNEVIRGLGFEPRKDEIPEVLTPEKRREILDELARGNITPGEAQRLLRGEAV